MRLGRRESLERKEGGDVRLVRGLGVVLGEE